MKLDCPAQRLLITALKTQIESWKSPSHSGSLSEEDNADLQNDIGYAYTLPSEMESSFYKELGIMRNKVGSCNRTAFTCRLLEGVFDRKLADSA